VYLNLAHPLVSQSSILPTGYRIVSTIPTSIVKGITKLSVPKMLKILPSSENMSAFRSVQELDKQAETSATLTSYYKSGRLFSSVSAAETPPSELSLNFLTFLAVSQRRGIDYLPITWLPGLESVGSGSTADIRQSLINLQLSFAFKRIHLERLTTNSQRDAFLALISEVFVLGHPVIRGHENVIRLEGICWARIGIQKVSSWRSGSVHDDNCRKNTRHQGETGLV
jgi:hypothetical protein